MPKFGYFRLVEVAKKMTRFAIKSITVYGSRICVASFTDSITFYDYDPEHKTIEFVKRYEFAFFKDHFFFFENYYLNYCTVIQRRDLQNG